VRPYRCTFYTAVGDVSDDEEALGGAEEKAEYTPRSHFDEPWQSAGPTPTEEAHAGRKKAPIRDDEGEMGCTA
jgi:hypothetical protein